MQKKTCTKVYSQNIEQENVYVLEDAEPAQLTGISGSFDLDVLGTQLALENCI